MQSVIFGLLAVGIILAVMFNYRSRQIAQRYPAQLTAPNLTPSAKWRVNLRQLYVLSEFVPQLYRVSRAVSWWMTGFLAAVVATLAVLTGAVQVTTIALIWPVLTGLTAVGFGMARIKLFNTQLIAWQRLRQAAPAQAAALKLDQVALDKLQLRVRALVQAQYLMVTALVLLAIDLELALVTLLAW